MRRYTRADVELDVISGWILHRKISGTRAARIDGPFEVETREGVLTCQDGYLAVDSGGWPYPIAADEFERIYVADASDPLRERVQALLTAGDAVSATYPYDIEECAEDNDGRKCRMCEAMIALRSALAAMPPEEEPR